jgi:very-short-patch-repair endonuclease
VALSTALPRQASRFGDDGWVLEDLRLVARDDVFSTTDARAMGVGSAALARLTARQEVTHLMRGWYAVGPPPDARVLHRLRTAALVRQYEGRAVASHHSALLLDDLPLYRADLSRVHLCRVADRHTRRTATFSMHPALGDRPAESPSAARSLSVPTAVAVVQAGMVNHPMTALVAADAALHRGLTSASDLAEALGSLSRQPGLAGVRAILNHADGRHESPGETCLAHVLRLLAFDAIPQVWVEDAPERWRVDFLLKDAPVVVEFDGLQKYASGAEALVREKLREDRLRALGYEVVRITWADLAHPERIRRLLEAAVRRAHRAA